MPKYYIKRNSTREIISEISEADFTRWIALQRAAIALSEIETMYSISVRSYLELESFLMETALQFSANRAPLELLDGTNENWLENCNLKVLNILNAHTAYLDHLPQRLVDLEGLCPKLIQSMKAKASKTFDSCFEYRIVMLLRNISQHSHLPIKGQYYSMKSRYEGDRETTPPSVLRVSIDPYFVSHQLVNAKKGRAKTRQEINDLGLSMLDAKMTLRLFVQAFFDIHDTLRTLTERVLEDVDAGFAELQSHPKTRVDSDSFGFVLEDEGGGSYFFSRDLPSTIRKKRDQWTAIRSVAKRYVSSEATKRNDTYYGSDPQIWVN
ncbi:hypothetical protein [Pseudosulfitobacter sp. SM2401]|uniref:hypothetical protein n=1 Tax=Pseudosulfitobacter sp. SM2401 TaxID=3350098 RepID=UPI0036F1BA66